MPKRVQLRRSRGWRLPEGAMKVDRSTRWGNPFRIGAASEDGPLTAERSISLYRAYLQDRLAKEPEFLGPLAGKDLACWCKPGAPCHADVLIELANKKAQ